MTLNSKIAMFSAELEGRAPIAPPGPGFTPVKMYERQANMTLLDVLTRRSVNPSLEAMRS
jgi:hypothetical protein